MWPEFRKNCFCWWHRALHWWEEHRDLRRFWLWYYFLPWNSSKNQADQPRTEVHFPIPWKPKCIPSNDQHNCFFDEQHSSSIFLNPYNLWDKVPAALMSLNHTNDRYSFQSVPSTNNSPTENRLISGVLFSKIRLISVRCKPRSL